jgi:IS30 family transposase
MSMRIREISFRALNAALDIAYSLNTRPRPVLGFQTPKEVFMTELSKLDDALQI